MATFYIYTARIGGTSREDLLKLLTLSKLDFRRIPLPLSIQFQTLMI
jgi:hypothetical protein